MEITELQKDLAATFRWTARLNMNEAVAICSGVFGKSGCLLAVSPDPVTAQDTKTLLFII